MLQKTLLFDGCASAADPPAMKMKTKSDTSARRCMYHACDMYMYIYIYLSLSLYISIRCMYVSLLIHIHSTSINMLAPPLKPNFHR